MNAPATTSTCARKVRYERRCIAKLSLSAMKKRVFAPETLSVYRCKECRGYHIGNVVPYAWRRWS